MMADSSASEESVLPIWLKRQKAGEPPCLVTLVGIEGSCPRPLGSQIVVTESGFNFGHITDGCAEEAILSEAVYAIQSGQPRLVRYGRGSPYKDITLPCGSGLDLYFTPQIDVHSIETVVKHQWRRTPSALKFNFQQNDIGIVPFKEPLAKVAGGSLYKPYLPALCLKIYGKGRIALALARLASLSGFSVDLISSDEATLTSPLPPNVSPHKISMPSDAVPIETDAWTAVALLFHDHDWEYPILADVLTSDAFYIGALGSRKTQAVREALLLDMNLSKDRIARLKAPIGLDIQATTPEEIAISIMAEVIQTYRARSRGPARW